MRTKFSFKDLNPARFGVGALVLGAIVSLALMPVAAADKPAPPQSSAFGKSLEDWQDTYWRWALGAVAIKPDANGNAVVKGNVVLMPLPDAPGDGTPGAIDVTLASGQSFMLPLLMLLGNSYDDGTPSDTFVSPNDFKNIDLSVRVDGVEIIKRADSIKFYTQATFDPPIPTGSYPAIAWIWFQGIGFVHSPLTPGLHTLTLDVRNTYPEYHFTQEFHNTWNITVQHGK